LAGGRSLIAANRHAQFRRKGTIVLRYQDNVPHRHTFMAQKGALSLHYFIPNPY
jgi:hypothetical protein